MRIVIDGTTGSGKTTFLRGYSERSLDTRYFNMQDLGYVCFSELIRGTIKARQEKSKDPFDDWYDFFKIALDRGTDFFSQGKDEVSLFFYDRGLPYLEIMAQRYGVALPNRYYELCQDCRYDSPVFVFQPIKSYDDLHAHKLNPVRKKPYSLEERLCQHEHVKRTYEKWGYKVVEVPVFFDGNPNENNKKRYEFIMEHLNYEK